ncbi:MAG TPA: DoxX family protein, partial [bacterium]|nr:DoxX family protein [bacterium]
QSLGFPAPQALAWIVSLLEFGGGIAMVLGLFVRPIGILYIVEMLVTTFRAKMARGVGFIDRSTGWEVDLLLAAIALALVLLGSGAFGLDAALRSKKGTRFR